MQYYVCDGCGEQIGRHDLRYTVSIDVRAAYDEVEVGLTDLVRSHRQEILELIEKMRGRDAKALEEQVYKKLSLDLCPRCQRAFLKAPLRFHPEQGTDAPPVDIDAFLRSMGFGEE